MPNNQVFGQAEGGQGGAIVSLYQNGGYDEPLQMRLARSPQRSVQING